MSDDNHNRAIETVRFAGREVDRLHDRIAELEAERCCDRSQPTMNGHSLGCPLLNAKRMREERDHYRKGCDPEVRAHVARLEAVLEAAEEASLCCNCFGPGKCAACVLREALDALEKP